MNAKKRGKKTSQVRTSQTFEYNKDSVPKSSKQTNFEEEKSSALQFVDSVELNKEAFQEGGLPQVPCKTPNAFKV